MREFITGGYFSLSNAFFGNDWDNTQGGGTVSQWKQEYEERVKKEVIDHKVFFFSWWKVLYCRDKGKDGTYATGIILLFCQKFLYLFAHKSFQNTERTLSS